MVVYITCLDIVHTGALDILTLVLENSFPVDYEHIPAGIVLELAAGLDRNI